MAKELQINIKDEHQYPNLYILQHVTGLSFSRLITSAKSPVQEASENIFGRDESKNQKGKVIDAYFQSDLKDQVVSHLIKIKWAKRIIREGAQTFECVL